MMKGGEPKKGKEVKELFHESVFVKCVRGKQATRSNINTSHQHKKIEEEKI
jgi:hypothetical protein